MTYLIALITAMVISMAIIPVMARLAPRLGMVDRPDPRKVHTVPVPRAGGVGIVLGALVPMLLWLPMDDLIEAYLFGSLVLLVFGAWDDICELGHYVKFIGQFIAVLAVVYYGDLYVTHMPFLGAETLPESVGRPFTVFAMIGVINALNHSDGLDGLAGGMSLLSLACIAYLAHMADGTQAMFVVSATLGGILGFLRFNTHPAKVFMGDGGSQFLGFTLAFLAVYLIERVNPALSPALPALFLGLPVIDIIAVFTQRIYHGMNWFRASKNHIHHRLLELGFDHYEAVVVKYSVQAIFVVCAVLLSYESDLLILAIYLGISAILFMFLTVAEHRGWKAHARRKSVGLLRFVGAIKGHRLFSLVPLHYVAVAISLLFVTVSAMAGEVPHDLAIVSAILAATLIVFLLIGRDNESIVVRTAYYVAAALIVYLDTKFFGTQIQALGVVKAAYYALLAVATGFSIRYASRTGFKTTPMDYLVLFLVVLTGVMLHNLPEKQDIGFMAVKLMILFYGFELVVANIKKTWNVLNISVLASLLLLTVRGFI